MIESLFAFFVLIHATPVQLNQSLAEAPRSLSSVSAEEGTLVKDSKMVYVQKKTVPGSGTEFVIKKILEVEKIMQGVPEKNEKEMKKRDPEIRRLISSVLDLDSLGKAALITHWANISKLSSGKKDLDRYMKLFRDLVEENYLEKIRTYVGSKYRITFVSEEQAKKGTLVQATIKKKDADLVVEFLLRKADSSWLVIDTRLDETSLEETYRGSFNRIIKKQGGIQKGFPELIKVMEKRLSELRKGKATKL
jgi:ABC-type transporter MlaC component